MNPRRIFLAPGAIDHFLCRHVLEQFPEARKVSVENPDRLPLPTHPRKRFIEAKRSLLLCEHKGPLLRPLSRPYGEAAPEYYLFVETGCVFDCQYCFLQDWLSHPVPTIHVNQEPLAEQIDEAVKENGGRLYLHAGEMADALALDRFTDLSFTLRKACERLPGLTCELRTKSDRVDRLLVGRPAKNLIVSWTLAPESSTDRYDLLASRLSARIEAAARVSAAGYLVALRLDPVICEGDFVRSYHELLERIADRLPTPPVAVSAGSLRLTTGCLNLARSRFPKSRLFAGELVPGKDGKWRYARPLRQAVYEAIAEQVRKLWRLELKRCMEPE